MCFAWWRKKKKNSSVKIAKPISQSEEDSNLHEDKPLHASEPAWQEEAHREFLRVLAESNSKTLNQVDLLINYVQIGFWSSLFVYGIILFVGLFAVIGGVIFATTVVSYTFRVVFSLSLVSAGILILIILLYRNPLRSLRKSMVDLLRANVILLGYINQINQITGEIGLEEERARATRSATNFTLDETEAVLDESN